jgi:hypothetical protein
MTKFTIGSVFILSLFTITFQSCSHYDEIQKNALESSVNGDSHNSGQNCMSCHHEKGNEAASKWWYIAGTAFDANLNRAGSGGMVELWTEPNRTGVKIYTLPIDRSGNFYTQKIINFQGGFYPVVIGNTGNINAMTTQTTEGACNSCHGVTENVIEID